MIQKVNFVPGDTVRVHEEIKERDPSADSGQVKTRIQVFEGIVLKSLFNKFINLFLK